MYALFKRPSAEWRAFFTDVAERVALLSKDPDRKVGAVLVSPDRRQMSFGYNGFPSSVSDNPALLEDKAFKLMHMVHAEDNCLRQAPFSAAGCTLYVTRFPCAQCAQKIVDAGITRVVAPMPELGHPRWGESWFQATQLFLQHNLYLSYMKGIKE